uniref:RRM domain-containing protein n=1 Tax=Aegilops tauschii subsp. strangulata TaxID=200361 RepID=A0A453D9N9_AEGTS
GPIEHIDLIRSGGYGSTAYVTFKEPYALETAVLLSGGYHCGSASVHISLGTA